MSDNLFIISDKDNVGTSLTDNFKYALRDINCGEQIIKYGFPIGIAVQNICEGEKVHTENVKSLLEEKSGYHDYKSFIPAVTKTQAGTFWGYRRKNGRVGIRNDIFIIPTVGCVNGICESLSKKTGAIALTHPYGCSQLGDDHENTRNILCNLVQHPNVGGVLVISLGCENNTLESFKALLELRNGYDGERIRFMTVQTERDEIEKGLELIAELKILADKNKRTECPLSSLVIGLKCGGSDGLSGITANPLVGQMSDRFISYGGSAVLTEIPEMFGAETIMLSRCKDIEIYRKLVSVIDRFKGYFVSHGERIDENPSPGNKAGGITTLAEKSLGCVQKGGTGAVVDVIPYGACVKEQGLTVLEGPGNDLVACTALMAAGAHMILFTTGRGTPLGCGVPVIKISTNTKLSEDKPSWIDFNAGQLLDKILDKDTAADELFKLILDTAEGKSTKNELNGYHEIAIWKGGVTL